MAEFERLQTVRRVTVLQMIKILSVSDDEREEGARRASVTLNIESVNGRYVNRP
jgi:hypothetical protein